MLITENTISQVRESSITEVVGKYVKFDRNGKACCPFHNEKTASFKVTEKKGVFKCFGCGESGDAIGFVMKHEKLDFISAVEKVASITGIQVEYEEISDLPKFEAKKALKTQLREVVNYSVDLYKKTLWELTAEHEVVKYLEGRKITKEIIAEWQLGWATEQWSFISPEIIKRGWYDPANKLGIVRRTKDNERNYDGYRSRIIFPITDKHGQYIGLAGRFIEIDKNDVGKEYAKYINPPDNDLYNKSSELYGLSQADGAIREKRFAYLVEGYFDVIGMHVNGYDNTVATCGTALTASQAKLLKNYTHHAVILRDGDAAGQRASLKDIDILLKAGFKIDIIHLPDGEDPDSFTMSGGRLEDLAKKDAVIWIVENKVCDILEDEYSLGQAQQEIVQFLMQIPNDIIRTNYFDKIIKKYKWNKSALQKKMNTLLEEQEEVLEIDGAMKFEAWMTEEQKEEVMGAGYLALNRKDKKGKSVVGYYSFNQSGKTQLTNFIVNPLFRIEAGQDSRYLSAIDNGRVKSVVDMPAKMIPSIDQFQGICVAMGSFVIFGSRLQWLRIASDLLQNYPSCIEVNELGWHKMGKFYAFVDRVYTPGGNQMIKLDEWGIVKFNDINYLIPAGSEAYRKLQQFGKDPYENQRFLTYKESPVTFEKWGNQMELVYGQKGIVGIAFAILSLFKDIIFDVDNNCPHLYGFGEPSSGKSKWAESITALFYYRRSAFNLNSGTDFAFFNYMSLFVNAPAHLNEFDIEVIKLEWFQAIKGAYDGEGRERGKLGSRNSTEIQKIASTLILTGQKLITADDNSVVTRSIIEPFSTNDNRTEEDKRAYDLLKDWERVGLNSILLEVLKYRDIMEVNYKDRLNNQLNTWRKENPASKNLNQRILQNFAHLATCYAIISEHINLPQSAAAYKLYCFEQATKWSSFIRSSDTLSEFWRTLEFLANGESVVEGWDFIVEQHTEVTICTNKRDQFHKHSFTEPTNVLYLRLNNLHKLFQTAYRNRTGKEAMSMENLLHYFSSRKYYIGWVKQKKFKRFNNGQQKVSQKQGFDTVERIESIRYEEVKNTSCYAFVYEDLEIDISHQQEPEKPPELPF